MCSYLTHLRRQPWSLVLNDSSDSAAATSGGRLFQSLAVSGKNEYCMVVVLQYGMKNFTVFPLVADMTGVK